MELAEKHRTMDSSTASGCSHSRQCCFRLRSRNTFMSVGSLGFRHPYGASRPGCHHFPLSGGKVSHQREMGQLGLSQAANPSLPSGLSFPRELRKYPPGALTDSQMGPLFTAVLGRVDSAIPGGHTGPQPCSQRETKAGGSQQPISSDIGVPWPEQVKI